MSSTSVASPARQAAHRQIAAAGTDSGSGRAGRRPGRRGRCGCPGGQPSVRMWCQGPFWSTWGPLRPSKSGHRCPGARLASAAHGPPKTRRGTGVGAAASVRRATRAHLCRAGEPPVHRLPRGPPPLLAWTSLRSFLGGRPQLHSTVAGVSLRERRVAVEKGRAICWKTVGTQRAASGRGRRRKLAGPVGVSAVAHTRPGRAFLTRTYAGACSGVPRDRAPRPDQVTAVRCAVRCDRTARIPSGC